MVRKNRKDPIVLKEGPKFHPQFRGEWILILMAGLTCKVYIPGTLKPSSFRNGWKWWNFHPIFHLFVMVPRPNCVSVREFVDHQLFIFFANWYPVAPNFWNQQSESNFSKHFVSWPSLCQFTPARQQSSHWCCWRRVFSTGFGLGIHKGLMRGKDVEVRGSLEFVLLPLPETNGLHLRTWYPKKESILETINFQVQQPLDSC